MSTTTLGLAERVITILRAHEAEPRAAGIRHLPLYRSVDLLPEPVEKQRLQASIERDRRRAF